MKYAHSLTILQECKDKYIIINSIFNLLSVTVHKSTNTKLIN